jgi:hypothetical protein
MNYLPTDGDKACRQQWCRAFRSDVLNCGAVTESAGQIRRASEVTAASGGKGGCTPGA